MSRVFGVVGGGISGLVAAFRLCGTRVRVDPASRTVYTATTFYGSPWWGEDRVETPLAFFAWKRGEEAAELFLAHEEDGETVFLQIGGFPVDGGDLLASLNRAIEPPPEPEKKDPALPTGSDRDN